MSGLGLTDPELTPDERAMLHGDAGPAAAFALGLVVRLGRILGARSLIPVRSAHIDGCLYHGQAGIDFVERLLSLGGRVSVPTTLNVGSIDLVHPALTPGPDEHRAGALRLMQDYELLGAEPTWTCAPYQISRRPAFGEHVAWAESNAIVFVNSVLGARTDRYGDFLDVCSAITGRAPYAGYHLTDGRRGEIVLDCSGVPADVLSHDAAWGALGHLAGRRAGDSVPVIAGITAEVTEDCLKALGAAAASSGGVGLFHMVGVTPEAPTLEAALQQQPPRQVVPVSVADLCDARDELSTVAGGRIDAVSVGTPHFSVTEFAQLAAMLGDGGPICEDVEFWVSTSRAVLAEADRLGTAEICRRAGARILVDTCTYLSSALRPGIGVVMTNSAKWAWYAPANIGVGVVYGTIMDCVASARSGHVVRDEISWGGEL
ncbi:MAG: aconitase X catalytic domain-containing protein [Nocardiopsaceae bacterium]|jgi:predicted aconitase|nr:aconitase X catalytic domain-containing protein [Nocardiopsaceae bacterium]